MRKRQREREELHVSAHPSTQFRVRAGRAGLGLGCAIHEFKKINKLRLSFSSDSF